jgi:hypothetical protein
MSKQSTHRALNRLLTVLERSLPMYLSYARPWTHPGDEKAVKTLKHIVEDQQQMAERVGQAVLDLGPIELGEYPIEFYDWHDLSLDFLLSKLVICQKRDIARIESCVSELQADRAAAALAEEALGAARGHLEALEEASGQPAPQAV